MTLQTQQGLVSAAAGSQKSAIKHVAAPTTGPIPGPVPVKLPPSPSLPQPAKYNSAAGLYGNQSSGYLKPAATGMINPSSASGGRVTPLLTRTRTPTSPSGPPAPVVLNPTREFNPTESATYKYLLETDTPPNIDKTKDYTAMNEHQPIYSEIYTAPKAASPGAKPIRPTFQSPRVGQVGASKLAPQGGAVAQDGAPSHVQMAALANDSPGSRGRSPKAEPIPLYETNSIGGRRRIAQSSSFNKLMMNMLGE